MGIAQQQFSHLLVMLLNHFLLLREQVLASLDGVPALDELSSSASTGIVWTG
jgi:hypothetical protein